MLAVRMTSTGLNHDNRHFIDLSSNLPRNSKDIIFLILGRQNTLSCPAFNALVLNNLIQKFEEIKLKNTSNISILITWHYYKEIYPGRIYLSHKVVI